MALNFGDRAMMIGGEWVTGDQWIDSVNPANEELIGRVPAGTAADVDRAVAAAAAAQPAWAALSIWERRDRLRAVGAAIKARAEEIKLMEAADSGNTIGNLNGDLYKASNHFDYFAGLLTELKGETIPASPGGLHMTIREPYGVVGRIVPFNHPFMFATANMAAPLAAGNSVILKTPETSPLSATIVGEICRELLPAGVVNIVSGYGLPVGDRIARHPQVRRIGFTGSVGTGLAIQRAAAETCVKHVTLELGGKNPLIIYPDADLEAAISGAVAGMNFAWAGQSCGSTSRILVHESLYKKAVELCTAKVEAIRVGDPLDPASQMGPVNSAGHLARIEALVSAGLAEGARATTGGGRPKGSEFERGFWFAPTVLADVKPGMRIALEEVFGPVMTIIPWSTEEEAIQIANETEFGLTASVWTQDIDRALRAARRIHSGVVTVNGTKMHFVGTPFGGHRNSGLGGEECLEELMSFTEVKSLHIMVK